MHTSVRALMFLSWSLLALGWLVLLGGGLLLGWALVVGHRDGWQAGVLMLFGGQSTVILALVFQLAGTRRSHFATNESVEALERQVAELRETTLLLESIQQHGSGPWHDYRAENAASQYDRWNVARAG
jgi:hypothetical protein